MGLQEEGSKFQRMTWKRFSELGKSKAIPILAQKYENNLNVIWKILQKCINNEWCYRISSDIFPLMTHPESNIIWEELPNYNELERLIRHCAEEAFSYDVRLSCHPDQFNVLASENTKAVEQTIKELNYHGWFMSKFGLKASDYGDCLLKFALAGTKEPHNLGYEAPINIHLNCSNGDPKDIAKRFQASLDRLDESAKARLVVENEDKGIWNVRNLIEHIHDLTGIPITFDYLHHRCNDGGLEEKEAFELCAQTWGKVRPLFHFSETLPGQNNPRKHADYPTCLPNTYDYDIDLDFEFKMKELAILKAQKIETTLEKTKITA